MSTALADIHEVPAESRVNYLNAAYGIKSWLLTVDHKRIGLLYLASITLMFFVGGTAAVLMRMNLIEPQGALLEPETYNKMFSTHGIIMVFFFLVPSIPATLGNFLIPIMIGARDVAFPKLNLMSWYLFITGSTFALYAVLTGGVDTGWTFYTPYSSTYAHTNVIAAALALAERAVDVVVERQFVRMHDPLLPAQKRAQLQARLEHLRFRRALRDAEHVPDLFVIEPFDVVQHERLPTSRWQPLDRTFEIDPRDRRVAPGCRFDRRVGRGDRR